MQVEDGIFQAKRLVSKTKDGRQDPRFAHLESTWQQIDQCCKRIHYLSLGMERDKDHWPGWIQPATVE